MSRPREFASSYKRLVQMAGPNFPIDFMTTDRMRSFIDLSKSGVDRSTYSNAVDEVSRYFNGTLRGNNPARAVPALMSLQRMFGPLINPLTTTEARNWGWVLYGMNTGNQNSEDVRLARAAVREVTNFFNDLKSSGQLA